MIRVLVTFCFLLFSCNAAEPVKFKKEYVSPERFEKTIQQFEAADSKKMPPQGAVVVTGSSSVRMWHKRIKNDLAPLTVIPRGFGGSNMNDLLHYSDRIVLKYKPRAVVIYEGDNDTAQGIHPLQVKAKFLEFAAKLKKQNKDIRIYIITVKPSIKRLNIWDKAEATNSIFKSLCEEDDNMFYVDTASALLENGKPRTDIFIKDNLHLNSKGYDLWSEAVKKVLLPIESKYEK
ncbi:MAG: GDSL-type esterase/lipase family protein [Lentisphaeraceae bacterium]|nr:GDSL-type esterase/lipase family protein [Lentisphaeraceae bacterium]